MTCSLLFEFVERRSQVYIWMPFNATLSSWETTWNPLNRSRQHRGELENMAMAPLGPCLWQPYLKQLCVYVGGPSEDRVNEMVIITFTWDNYLQEWVSWKSLRGIKPLSNNTRIWLVLMLIIHLIQPARSIASHLSDWLKCVAGDVTQHMTCHTLIEIQ